ncbi:MAG: hypothetical protein V4617_11355 [Gemmatimonadota bacterium]
MFATCIHCNRPLGANESIGTFPVGRRLAFDGARGRLWAVCQKCERWNLSPLEERWEAIEECERQFRGTRVCVSTENIGLAKLRDGTELVRVAKPLRPEFAAWRYGDQFGRRRRRIVLQGVGTSVAMAALIAGDELLGVGFGLVLHTFYAAALAEAVGINVAGRRPTLTALNDGVWVDASPHIHLEGRPDVPEGWGAFGVVSQFKSLPPTIKPWPLGPFRLPRAEWPESKDIHLRGDDAEPLLRALLPADNRLGSTHRRVQQGVSLIEAAGDHSTFGHWIAKQLPVWRAKQRFVDNGHIKGIPPAARLALEMSLHEESERRAMEGELHLLEAAWRQADEIAKIADELLLPSSIDSRLAQLRAHEVEPK